MMVKFLLANNILLNYFSGQLLMTALENRKQYLILLTSSLFIVNLRNKKLSYLTGVSFNILYNFAIYISVAMYRLGKSLFYKSKYFTQEPSYVLKSNSLNSGTMHEICSPFKEH